jgi:hypothetical protein
VSIRRYEKDHLKQHAGVDLIAQVTPAPPEHSDPLKFWTEHPTENMLVDLTLFAEGEFERPRGATEKQWRGPFTGRPQLILQLAPAVKEISSGYSNESVRSLYAAFRGWWRVLDAVENEAAEQGQVMTRVEDVRLLQHIHAEFAHRSKMRQPKFNLFLTCANSIRRNLGSPIMYWRALRAATPRRNLPPEDQTHALRIALKQAWEAVRREWTRMERVRTIGFVPQTEEEAKQLRHWRYFNEKQQKYSKALPTATELYNGLSPSQFREKTGMGISSMRAIAFPTRWDVDTAFHLCLANTGWNPAVLYSLDAENKTHFLRQHHKDDGRYLLIGTKAKAGGKEQPVSGLWKTRWGPGRIIQDWMVRVEPLREQLNTEVADARKLYTQMERDGASTDQLGRQLSAIQNLEAGCRSVWLYVSAGRDILWLEQRDSGGHRLNGKQATYLSVFIDQLNRERATRGDIPIPSVAQSDFRDIFATFLWRQSGGNLFVVMRLLNHAYLATTERYVDNTILNAERDQQARTFLDHLFAELGKGRVDIAILTHLQRHGVVTPEMEERLHDFRTLQRSRMGIACKDPSHPPTVIQSKTNGRQLCTPQRCLLCKSHAVILPESLPGVAMRVEELEAIQRAVSIENWLASDYRQELSNGLDVLKLFSADSVKNARARWAQAIETGDHHIPGLHRMINQKETV